MAGLRGHRPPRVIGLHQGLRVLTGGLIAVGVLLSVAAPYMPTPAIAAALAVLAFSLWRPEIGLIGVGLAAPAGLVLAPEPVRAAEMVTWAFLAGWLLRADRPLAPRGIHPALLIPVSLYVACVGASWLSVIIADAGGIDSTALPRFVIRAIGTDHLSATSPEPETWTMLLTVAGAGLLLAASGLTRAHPWLFSWLAGATGVSMAAMSISAVAAVLLQWRAQDFAPWFLTRFATIERVAVHTSDVNAAGSQYVLALLAAGGLSAYDMRRRWLWAVVALLMLPGLFLTGSRSAALTAVVIGSVVIAIARGVWQPKARQLVAGAAAIAILVTTAGVILAGGGDEQNSAGRAMRLRAEFTETSVRMFASAPLLGVGIGRYHGRSGDFMPAELKSLFGFENAHNYFAQQFAELGLVGGVLFLWLLFAALRRAWASRSLSWAHVGVVAGVIGYTVTCLTGHPLLVPEAAFPYWLLLGAVAIGAPGSAIPRLSANHTRTVLAAGALLIVIPVAAAVAGYRTDLGAERGFYPEERDAAGVSYRWMTRHGVSYVDAVPGFLTVTTRSANVGERPFELSIEVDGRELARQVVPPDRWTTITVPVRPAPESDGRRQRIDLRASHSWSKREALGARATLVPAALMVQLRWAPAR